MRRLCCDADLRRLVTKGDSIPIDVGRKTRTVPVATRKAVLARDGGCTYPGCHHRDGLQVHHLKHWAHLGATDLANLVCLCWRHHRLVHDGGWNLALDLESQRTIWTSPDGRRLIGQRRATSRRHAHRRLTPHGRPTHRTGPRTRARAGGHQRVRCAAPTWGCHCGSMSARRGFAWSRSDRTGSATPQSASIAGSSHATPSSSAGL